MEAVMKMHDPEETSQEMAARLIRQQLNLLSPRTFALRKTMRNHASHLSADQRKRVRDRLERDHTMTLAFIEMADGELPPFEWTDLGEDW